MWRYFLFCMTPENIELKFNFKSVYFLIKEKKIISRNTTYSLSLMVGYMFRIESIHHQAIIQNK